MIETLIQSNPWIIVLIMAWVLPWKGYALWTAAKRGHKYWFVVILVANTLAILDIIYIFFFSKSGNKDY